MGKAAHNVFTPVGGKVDDDELSARLQHACCFGQYACWVFRIVQNHLQHSGVEEGVRQRQPVHIGQPDGTMR